MPEIASDFPGRLRVLPYLIILALVVLIAYSFHRQVSSSIEGKVIEAGLIESGGRPALYFELRNTGKDCANYTYVVTYNTSSTEARIDRSSVTLPAGTSFSYSISLLRPSHGVMVLDLRVYGDGGGVDEALLHDQRWIIRAQT